jgi:predicted glycoside hydrolase/deacetylase ChbG (UPF0249 family)
MKVIIHADDFGITESITKNIVDTFKYSLNSTSIVTNCYYYKDAMQIYKDNYKKNIRLSLHLNLVEGKPENKLYKFKYLTDKKNFFNKTYFSLLIKYYLNFNTQKKLIRDEIKNEIESQIISFVSNSKNKHLSIDSHQHIHTLPFVFKVIIDLGLKYNIDYIRIPKEHFIFHKSILENPINIIKYLVLNFFCYFCLRMIKKTTINFNNYFIGVLTSGKMNYSYINKSLDRVSKNNNKNAIIEILFHPGQAQSKESKFWKKYPSIKKFYLSKDRITEKNILINNKII